MTENDLRGDLLALIENYVALKKSGWKKSAETDSRRVVMEVIATRVGVQLVVDFHRIANALEIIASTGIARIISE